MDLLHSETTEQIIGSAFEVRGTLGDGFLESVYQRAMQVESEICALQAICEHELEVHYKGSSVGKFRADILMNQVVIVELKVAREYPAADVAQLLKELKASGVQVEFLINFGRAKVEFKRLVF